MFIGTNKLCGPPDAVSKTTPREKRSLRRSGSFPPCVSSRHSHLTHSNSLGQVFNREKIKNVPNWVDFERKSISIEVRVSADSHGLGDHGLGTGLVVRRRRGGEID